jgi:hypothetical protein
MTKEKSTHQSERVAVEVEVVVVIVVRREIGAVYRALTGLCKVNA